MLYVVMVAAYMGSAVMLYLACPPMRAGAVEVRSEGL